MSVNAFMFHTRTFWHPFLVRVWRTVRVMKDFHDNRVSRSVSHQPTQYSWFLNEFYLRELSLGNRCICYFGDLKLNNLFRTRCLVASDLCWKQWPCAGCHLQDHWRLSSMPFYLWTPWIRRVSRPRYRWAVLNTISKYSCKCWKINNTRAVY